MPESPKIALAIQLRCVERELGYRRRMYPKWVQEGKLSEAKANLEIDTMTAVRDTLRTQVYLEEVSGQLAPGTNRQEFTTDGRNITQAYEPVAPTY